MSVLVALMNNSIVRSSTNPLEIVASSGLDNVYTHANHAEEASFLCGLFTLVAVSACLQELLQPHLGQSFAHQPLDKHQSATAATPHTITMCNPLGSGPLAIASGWAVDKDNASFVEPLAPCRPRCAGGGHNILQGWQAKCCSDRSCHVNELPG